MLARNYFLPYYLVMEIRPTQFSEWFDKRIGQAGSVYALAKEINVPMQTLYTLRKGGYPNAVTAQALGISLLVPEVA